MSGKRTVGFMMLPILIAVAVFGGVIPLYILKQMSNLSTSVFNLIAIIWAGILVALTLFLVTKWENRDKEDNK